MSQTLPTVQVVEDNEFGYMIINESDFDELTQKLFIAIDSDGAKVLTTAQIKDALTEKGIEFPVGAKKSDLKALLEAIGTET